MKVERRSFLKGLAALPFVSACGDTTETNLPAAAPVADVKILTQSWRSSQLTSKIAELLLREQLAVTAASSAVGETEIWEKLVSGAAHACLEVWPLRNGAGVRQFVEPGKVASIGTLGVGRTAFFVPEYVVDKVPAITTASTGGSLGELVKQAGITQLLVGPKDWVTPTLARLDGMGLGGITATNSANEKSFLTSIDDAFALGTPFMASLWYPHPVHSKYPLVAVGLPAATNCDVRADNYVCDYPAETILKVAAPGLKFTNPQVYAFLQAFAPPLDEIIGLLAGSEDAPEVLARNWIKTRNVVWTPWINAAKGAK